MQDHQLDPEQVFGTIGKKLAELGRVSDVEALIDCIKTSGASDVHSICDVILSSCVSILSASTTVPLELDRLVRLISNVDLKVSCQKNKY